jgi:nucleoside-triphosphatase THEP1
MNTKNVISEKWIKASIVGTIWAASEIVLGSFLHNLKIPFTSNILTAIGIVILISVSYIWTEKGLFWRAGLICALMKTMSPSAVIFGPMIAIFSEAALLDISVRLFGRTLFGYILGGVLAMSWNLFQKIINFIIFYGTNIVEIYTNLLKFAQKQLDIHFDIVWLPILVLLLIYSVFGILSAIIGIKAGRNILKQPREYLQSTCDVKNSVKHQNNTKPDFIYSLLWLFTNIIFITGSLILLNYSFVYWSSAIILIVTIWAFRYKRALRQLSKPKFWIFFVIITMITAFVFTKLQSKSLEEGLLIGIQMNFRAIVIIVGFSVLGAELYNPKIRQFFLTTYFKQLPLALELSFESLPSLIASIPDFKTIVKNPVSVIYQLISQAEHRLAEIKNNTSQKVFIISGAIGQGKTTTIQKIIEILKSESISVGGIYSLRIIENEITIGYDIVDIKNNKRTPFLRNNNNENSDRIGRFGILNEGIKAGKAALTLCETAHNSIAVIDEVGAMELEGKAWSENISKLLNVKESHLLLAVRDSNVDKIIKKWNFNEYYELKLHGNDFNSLSRFIIENINH